MEIPKHQHTYRKMQVLGPRQAVALDNIQLQHKQAKALRDYNPTLNAMAQAESEMHDILENASAPARKRASRSGPRSRRVVFREDDFANELAPTVRKRQPRSDSGTVRKRKASTISASSSVALHNACLERLHALKSQFDTSYEPLLHLVMQNALPAAAAVAPAAAAAAAAGAAAAAPIQAPAPGAAQPAPAAPLPPPPRPIAAPTTPTALPRNMRPILLTTVLHAIPKQHHLKYIDLHDYIAANPNIIGMTTTGRLVLNGATIHGSSFVDLIRALYVPVRGGETTPGLRELLGALSMLGVPPSVIAAGSVRNQYAHVRKQSAENTMLSPPPPPPGANSRVLRAQQQSGQGGVISSLSSRKKPRKQSQSTEFLLGQPPRQKDGRIHQYPHFVNVSTESIVDLGNDAPVPRWPQIPPSEWTKQFHQRGTGYVDSPCFPGRPTKSMRQFGSGGAHSSAKKARTQFGYSQMQEEENFPDASKKHQQQKHYKHEKHQSTKQADGSAHALPGRPIKYLRLY
ncbi:MAG: hypothetical protein HYS08_10680 [Chlamydiae bacterium]|nr:hypothetical protein [Chlamydiota bacterium]